MFQGVTHIAPATNMVFTFPIIALKAGPDMPLSFLLATVVCFFIGNTVSQFSRFMPSSGGYYSFATRGLGSRIGFMAAWSYLTYDLLGAAGSTGFLGYLLSDMVHTAFHVNVPWWVIALATFAVVWLLTHYGIQLSARVTAILGGLELLIMLALAITFLLHPGSGSTYAAPLDPTRAPHHAGGILAGMVFSILALSGFEASAPLAQESRRAGKSIGQAVMLSLGATGVFFIFTSYASAIGWGTGNMAAFAADPNPYYAMGHALWGTGWWLVVLAVINSSIGVGLASTNSASRVLYTMGQAGTLPARFATIHPTHQTPAFAVAAGADRRHCGGAAGRFVAGAQLHLWLVGDDCYAGGDWNLLFGQCGTHFVHTARASSGFQHMAASGVTMDSDSGSAAGAVGDGLSGAFVAVQHRPLFVCWGFACRVRVYGVAGTAEARRVAPRCDGDGG